MKANEFKQPATWRAVFLAVALLVNSLSPALSLYASEPEFCEMACCVADGHCCCAARKLWVKGQKPEDHPLIEQVEVASQSGCPCTPPSSSIFIQREIARPSAHDFDLGRPHIIAYHNPSRAHHSVWFTTTPPRAPPGLLI
jgi:hypothetical protein